MVKTNAVTCEHCLKIYHPSCTILKAVRNTHNNIMNACRSCIAVANANSYKRDSISEKDNSEHPVTNTSTEPTESDSRTHAPNSSSDPLQQILQKLTKLESLDNRLTEIQASSNTRLNEVFTRITNLERRLAPLEDLLIHSAAEEAITKIQTEQANLHRQYDELCAANSAAAPDVSSVRRIEKLENDYRQLNAAQQNLSNELVITGLASTDTTSLKGAVYAALKVLDVELLESDIRHVREMRQKPSSEPLNHTTPITSEELQNLNAGESPTMAPQTSSQPTRVDTRP